MNAKRIVTFFCFTAILIVLFIGASNFKVNRSENGILSDVDRGKELYEKSCASCHGMDGKGEGIAAVYLFPKPRDFTRGIFKFQSTPAGSLPTDEDILRTIEKGMPGSAMPAWDQLSVQDRNDLVAYVKTFSERFTTETPEGEVAIGAAPPRTSQMIHDGKMVYALMSCWSCHGKTGAGDGPSAKDLKDDLERPIRSYNFTRAGAFKGGGTPRDIYRTFSTGIGGTPMPGYGEDAMTLTKESFTDLENLEGQYSPTEIHQTKRFVDQLPTESQLTQMSDAERKALSDTRRWSLVYYTLSLAQPGKTQISYTTVDHPLVSVPVDNIAQFSDPASVRWNDINDVELALISLWQRDTPTDRVHVKSVVDKTSIAFRLEWEDSTKDDGALYNAAFGDASAIQFPLDPRSEPFFAMGDTDFVTNIWHWKSWWERDVQAYAGVASAFPRSTTDGYLFDVSGGAIAELFMPKDSVRNVSLLWNAGWASGNLLSEQKRTTSVEDLNAKGFGTLTSQSLKEQNVKGKGVWNNAKWNVVFVRTLNSSDKNDVVLKTGMLIPVAVAIWDGSLGDRNGQKMVTNWYRLTIGTK